jgi:hypothetical protein
MPSAALPRSYRPLLPLHSPLFAWLLSLGSPRQRHSRPPLFPSRRRIASNATRVEQSDGGADGLLVVLSCGTVRRRWSLKWRSGWRILTGGVWDVPLSVRNLPRSLRTTPLRRSHNRRLPPAASGVQSRRGKPLGRTRRSGGFARRANVDDHEAARACCEPRRRLDAVERWWFWRHFGCESRVELRLHSRLFKPHDR